MRIEYQDCTPSVWRLNFVVSYGPMWRWFAANTGKFKVLPDGDTVIDGGAAAFLGVLPTRKQILAAIRDRLPS